MHFKLASLVIQIQSLLKQNSALREMLSQTSVIIQNLPCFRHLPPLPGCIGKMEGTQNVLQETKAGTMVALTWLSV